MNKKFTFILLAGILCLIALGTAVGVLNNETSTAFSRKNPPEHAAAEKTAAVTQAQNSNTDGKIKDNISLKDDYMKNAVSLFDKTHYKKTLELLDKALNDVPGDPDLTALRDKAMAAEDEPVLYKGQIYHIFFHSLIIYPEMCLTGDSMEQGYNEWMTTVKEFKQMIEEMYQRGYTLVDLRDIFIKDASGKMVKQDIYLPQGQKPLVISVDDMSYYKYMEKDGFAKRLILDDNGNLASLVDDPQGKEYVSPEGDVVPIINNFVAENPDFSYKGAGGTLALTGYEGILGYRTNHNNPDWQKEKEKIIPVINKLKETGWAFASHSYSHNRGFTEGTITLAKLKNDTQKWREEVGSIVGPTNIFISPFGATFGQKDQRFRYIVDQGFNVYCGIGPKPFYQIYKDNAYMERIDVDGYKMHYMPEVMKDLFDVSKVYDPARPAFKQ